MTSGMGGKAIAEWKSGTKQISGTLYCRELSNNSNLTANPWYVEIKKAI
jgi:hypothetical protein